jgi:hypothetical protein
MKAEMLKLRKKSCKMYGLKSVLDSKNRIKRTEKQSGAGGSSL